MLTGRGHNTTDDVAARANLRLSRCGGQCRTDGVLAGRLALLVRVRPVRGPPHRCADPRRQLSASGPASTTLYPMESMNSVTAAFAGAEPPAIGRYERSTAPAGRASDSRCL